MSGPAFEWHAKAWRLAHAAIDRGAHALLIAGAQGVGKRAFALELAASHLCDKPAAEAAPCRTCESCRWLLAGTHPDFLLVEPVTDEGEGEAPGRPTPAVRERPIGIDQVRSLGAMLALTSHRESGKVVVLHPADALNLSAANALLKSLEEPPPRTLFLLVANRPALLPATVRSRCQLVPVRVDDPRAAERWLREQGVEDQQRLLALSGGAPLEALAAATEPHARRRPELIESMAGQGIDGAVLAERFGTVPIALLLSWLQKWTFDLLQMRLTGRARYHLDVSETTRTIAAAADVRALVRLHRRLLALGRHVHHPLNPRLFTEQVLIECCRVLVAPAHQPA